MRPAFVYDMEDLFDWCTEYQDNGPHRQGALIRFNIGIYQISQGIAWKDKLTADQSYLAAAMHFIMAAHEMKLLPQFHFTWPMYADLTAIEEEFIGWQAIMKRVGDVTQQIIYSLHNVPGRKSRYNAAKLETDFAALILTMISLSQADKREELIHNEMCILTKDILRS